MTGKEVTSVPEMAMTNPGTQKNLAVCKDFARHLFEEVRAEFQHLNGSIDLRPAPPINVSLTFNSQSRLPFRVIATLQGDELGLGVGDAFWCEWFPCTDNEVATKFTQALHGVLSGRLQVVEFRRGKTIIKAQLQQQCETGWETIATWSKARFPSLARSGTTILRTNRET